MAKAIDKGMVISEVTLVEKTKEAGVRAAVLTVSDRVSRGEAEDGSGDTLEELLRADGYEVDAAAGARRGRRRSPRRSSSSPARPRSC